MLFLGSAAVVNSPITTPYFLQHILPSLWERFVQIAAAPVRNPEMLLRKSGGRGEPGTFTWR